jgi:hypothetical protein
LIFNRVTHSIGKAPPFGGAFPIECVHRTNGTQKRSIEAIRRKKFLWLDKISNFESATNNPICMKETGSNSNVPMKTDILREKPKKYEKSKDPMKTKRPKSKVRES